MPFRHWNDFDVRYGHGCRASELAVNQRHFTKYVISGEFGYRPVADLDAHVTALDNEKLVTRFALRKMMPPARMLVSTSFPVKTPKSVLSAIAIYQTVKTETLEQVEKRKYKVPEIIMATGNVSTQAIAMLRTVDH